MFKVPPAVRPARLHAFDNFRAIAIVLIVMGHTYGPWAIDTLGEQFVATFITGGTALFVFISGFFFHNTYYSRFSWGPFLRTKLVNIGVPYLVLTGLYCAVQLLILGLAPVAEFYRWSAGGIADFVLLYLQYAATGRSFDAYWYVPFILLIFAASPLFMRFIALKCPAQLVVFGSAVLVSMIVHRPLHNENPMHSALYFSSVYLLGILTSVYRADVFAFIQRHAIGLGVIVGIVALLKIAVDGDHLNQHKAGIFTLDGIDVSIVLKCLQAALMLSLLLHFANRRIPVLLYVAERSFGIFFLHNWATRLLVDTVPWMTTSSLPGVFMFLITATLTFAASIAATDAIHAILKDRSRLVIGY